MRRFLVLFIGTPSLIISDAITSRYGNIDIKIKKIVFNEDSNDAEEEPDCE